MFIPNGTSIKCLKDVSDNYGRISLTKGKYYEVKNTCLASGHLNVSIIDDRSVSCNYGFDLFEDIATSRDELLNSLLGS